MVHLGWREKPAVVGGNGACGPREATEVRWELERESAVQGCVLGRCFDWEGRLTEWWSIDRIALKYIFSGCGFIVLMPPTYGIFEISSSVQILFGHVQNVNCKKIRNIFTISKFKK